MIRHLFSVNPRSHHYSGGSVIHGPEGPVLELRSVPGPHRRPEEVGAGHVGPGTAGLVSDQQATAPQSTRGPKTPTVKPERIRELLNYDDDTDAKKESGVIEEIEFPKPDQECRPHYYISSDQGLDDQFEHAEDKSDGQASQSAAGVDSSAEQTEQEDCSNRRRQITLYTL